MRTPSAGPGVLSISLARGPGCFPERIRPPFGVPKLSLATEDVAQQSLSLSFRLMRRRGAAAGAAAALASCAASPDQGLVNSRA